tara:strand:+ start:3035 stop:3532 length:498 start_codon:yes stop_codon:yes gene_type:complete
MEDQEVYHVLPDNVLSVLDQFNTSKEGITLFASKVINEVEAGNVDPLKVKLYCKTMESIAEKIDKGTIENQKTAAAKYGEKPFMFSGAELHLTATYTVYDFANCGDSKLVEMEAQMDALKKEIEARKTFLKSITQPFTKVDEDGTVEVLSPPNKKQTMGVKCSIK